MSLNLPEEFKSDQIGDLMIENDRTRPSPKKWYARRLDKLNGLQRRWSRPVNHAPVAFLHHWPAFQFQATGRSIKIRESMSVIFVMIGLRAVEKTELLGQRCGKWPVLKNFWRIMSLSCVRTNCFESYIVQKHTRDLGALIEQTDVAVGLQRATDRNRLLAPVAFFHLWSRDRFQMTGAGAFTYGSMWVVFLKIESLSGDFSWSVWQLALGSLCRPFYETIRLHTYLKYLLDLWGDKPHKATYL